MKKNYFFLMMLLGLFSIGSYAQNSIVSDTVHNYNRWSIEGGVGLTKPYQKFAPGYHAATPDFFVGELDVRYMFNELAGLQLGFGYNNFSEADNSMDFGSEEYRISLEGVVNVGRVLKFEDWTKTINLLAHGGFGVGLMQYETVSADDYVGNAIAGLTGQIKLSPRAALKLDFSGLMNVRQNLTFDGRTPTANTKTQGWVFNSTVGVAFYLGKNKTHADWYIRGDRPYEVLDGRIADLEKRLKKAHDTDAGKTEEEMADLNSKIDDLDGRLKVVPSDNYADFIARLINDGYLNIYFDFNSTKIEDTSTDVVNFLRTYLQNNPGVHVNLVGYADEKGTDEYNLDLSQKRAEVVADLLVKAGIAESRLKAEGQGEDTSVDESSEAARRLARRVSFVIQ